MHPFPAEKAKIIYTKGSDYDIGVEHALYVGSSLEKGMLKFYFDFWKKMSLATPSSFSNKLFWGSIKTFINKFLFPRLIKNIPDELKNRIQGICSQGLIKENDALITLLLIDVLPMLQAYSGIFRPKIFIAPKFPALGCSSFIYNGKNFLIGRNLDFPGVSYWDRYPVIQLIEKNGSIPYIAFTSAGIPLGGITGINKERISVFLHQHYTLETSISGVLPFVISEKILEKASSIEDAINIAKSFKLSSSWAFIISDGKKREGCVIECTPKNIAIRHLEKVITHSNYFQKLKNCREYATTERMNWDNFFRNERLKNLLEMHGDSLTISDAILAISDHFDSFWQEEKYINRTISQVYNIQSLVIDSENLVAYFAEGASPIHIRNYYEYDLNRIFDKNGSIGNSVLNGFRFKNENKHLAKEYYILSFISGFEGKYEIALENLEKALLNDFSIEGALVKGILHLMLGQYEKSAEVLSYAKDWAEKKKNEHNVNIFPPEYFELTLFLARTYDLMGKYGEARLLYNEIRCHKDLKDSHIRELTFKYPYKEKNLKNLIMPYSTYIPFE